MIIEELKYLLQHFALRKQTRVSLIEYTKAYPIKGKKAQRWGENFFICNNYWFNGKINIKYNAVSFQKKIFFYGGTHKPCCQIKG